MSLPHCVPCVINRIAFVVRAIVGNALDDYFGVVAAGEALLSPTVTRRLIAEFASRTREPASLDGMDELTPREREVVALIASGLSNDEISRKIYVSPSTVKTHAARAMTKLRARDRAQLVVFAYQAGLVRPGWAD